MDDFTLTVVPETANEKLSLGDKGAVAELVVAADLMQQGWDVFRNMSPNGPIDLIAFKDGNLSCIQVKSATEQSIDTIRRHMDDACDVLAVVYEKKIIYFPHPTIVPDFCLEDGTIEYVRLKAKAFPASEGLHPIVPLN